MTEARTRRHVPRAAAAGVAAAIAGAALIAVSGRSLTVSFAALFLVVTGMALVTPWVTTVFVRLIGPVARAPGGSLGVMASRGVVAALSRTATKPSRRAAPCHTEQGSVVFHNGASHQ